MLEKISVFTWFILQNMNVCIYEQTCISMSFQILNYNIIVLSYHCINLLHCSLRICVIIHDSFDSATAYVFSETFTCPLVNAESHILVSSHDGVCQFIHVRDVWVSGRDGRNEGTPVGNLADRAEIISVDELRRVVVHVRNLDADTRLATQRRHSAVGRDHHELVRLVRLVVEHVRREDEAAVCRHVEVAGLVVALYDLVAHAAVLRRVLIRGADLEDRRSDRRGLRQHRLVDLLVEAGGDVVDVRYLDVDDDHGGGSC